MRLVPADTLADAALHAATLAAFADYLAGPFQMTPAQFPNFVARQGVDLARSRVALQDDGSIAAFGYVCPRPEVGRWRLAVMGALPAARGTGAAPALLDDFVARTSAEGLPWAELECFADNARALRLYRGRGFEVVAALNGWKRPEDDATPAEAPPPGVRAVDRAAAFAWLAEANVRLPWLPFPNTDRCLSAQPRPLRFWQCGSAQAAFSVLEGTPTQIHGLLDLDPALRDAETLAHALRAAHPGAFAPPILRDDYGGAALARAGFAPHGLGQVLMRRRR